MLDALGALRFGGEVWAVPEGRVVYANEPLLEITAPIAVAQLVEPYLLNQITFQTTIASKAARCVVAAAGRDVVDFSLRRTQGLDAALAAARCSAIVGFAATSNVEAARRYGLQPSGTMAHSYIESFASEKEAFRTFARDFPGRTTFLVDTYDTLNGVRTAIEVIGELGLSDNLAVRLDSGDLGELSRGARTLLDDAGLQHVRIFASGGLDEVELDRLVRGGAPIDAFGVGTRMGVSADAPSLDSAYKLVEYDGRPMLKLSEAKATEPGRKQVFRGRRRGRGGPARRAAARGPGAVAGPGDGRRPQDRPAQNARDGEDPVPSRSRARSRGGQADRGPGRADARGTRTRSRTSRSGRRPTPSNARGSRSSPASSRHVRRRTRSRGPPRRRGSRGDGAWSSRTRSSRRVPARAARTRAGRRAAPRARSRTRDRDAA